MHYDLSGGIIVKSENAAKPASQTSKYLVAMMDKLPQVNRTLDYGYHGPPGLYGATKNPPFHILRFDNKNTVGRHHDMIDLCCSTFGRQRQVSKDFVRLFVKL
jgi:hypothetical protein